MIKRYCLLLTVAGAMLPAIAFAGGRVVVGVGIGAPIYGPAYYYPPAYYYHPYYVAPPAVIVTQPEPPVVVQAPPVSVWYYCDALKTYYPYVSNCPSGWREVPAQAAPPRPAAP